MYFTTFSIVLNIDIIFLKLQLKKLHGQIKYNFNYLKFYILCAIILKFRLM